MKLKRLLAAASALLLAAGTQVFAQDDDWDWSFDDDDSSSSSSNDDFSSFDDESSDDDFSSFGSDDDFSSFGDDDDFSSFGDDDFGSSFGGDDSGSSLPITFTGDFSLDTRLYFAQDDSENFLSSYFSDPKAATAIRIGKKDADGHRIGITDSTLKAFPKAKLGVEYSGSSADALLTVNLTKETLTDYKEDIIDELIIRGYFLDRHLVLEAGKMKVVWGKGDKLHVLDNFNADDYTDFIIPDYIDRRISTPMLRAVYSFDNAIAIEGVFTPFLPKDRFAKEGMWVPGSYAKLNYTVKDAIMSNVSSGWTSLAEASSFDEDDLYPNVYNLKYAQGGLHITGTAGMVDWGASYYIGRYKQPSANLENMIVSVMTDKAVEAQIAQIKASTTMTDAQKKAYISAAQEKLTAIALPELDYDLKQTVGLEGATVVGRFNLRAEAGYNITKDIAGDDPWVHNNSISWLGGFDLDLPISNINLNVQETGTYILQSSKIKKGTFKEYDVDYDPKNRYTNNKLVVNISDSWMHDKVKPEITVMWGIERGDLVIQPKISYNPTPELTLSLNAMCIFCRDEYSEFSYWKNNNFVNLGVRFQF
mgnify:CR=1 FL=1